MNKSFKVLFFLKKGNGYKGGAMPIYVRITINCRRAELSVQRTCEPKKWNQAVGRSIGKGAEAMQLNSYLQSVQAKIFDIQKEYELKNENITSELVKQKLLGICNEKQHRLVEVYEYHNKQVEELVGVEYSKGTLKRFKCALKSLKDFLKWKFNQTDINIKSLNHQFITDFEFYLKSVQAVQHNTAMGIIKKLKKIVRQCVANDWLDKDPFMSYKIKLRDTHRQFLTLDELHIIENKELPVDRLGHVRDIFIFSCYTGLSFSDVEKLTPLDIVIGIDGEKWIYTTRTKTDTDSRIPLLPEAQDLIEKYNSNRKANIQNRLFPLMSNQKMNAYLKELAGCCGISKDLTFHCARHTFATTVTLANGVPIETVSKMLGHKSIRTTQQYAKIVDTKVSDDMKVLKNKLREGKDCAMARKSKRC